jgi:hypothetical protein
MADAPDALEPQTDEMTDPTLTDPTLTCQHVDLALSLQQTIRERDTEHGIAPATEAIGEACGRQAIGMVEHDGVRHRFCAGHVLEDRISR